MKELLQWLANENQRISEYHNHKENMAWAATVFYISGTLFLGGFGNELTRNAKVFIFFALILSFIVFVPFLIFQFSYRRLAAKRSQSLLEASFRLLEDGQSGLSDIQQSMVAELSKKYSSNGAFNPAWTEGVSYFSVTLAFLLSIVLLMF